MSASLDPCHRRLQVLGVVPYRLRGTETPSPARSAETSVAWSAGTVIPYALLLPENCAPQSLDLLDRAMHAFGADLARAPRVLVAEDGLLQAPPTAGVYLAFGEAQARALEQVFSAAVMRKIEVVLLDLPQALHAGTAKRRLWLALKALRQRLRVH